MIHDFTNGFTPDSHAAVLIFGNAQKVLFNLAQQTVRKLIRVVAGGLRIASTINNGPQ